MCIFIIIMEINTILHNKVVQYLDNTKIYDSRNIELIIDTNLDLFREILIEMPELFIFTRSLKQLFFTYIHISKIDVLKIIFDINPTYVNMRDENYNSVLQLVIRNNHNILLNLIL